VARLGLADCFDVIVSSARAGARKPHPRIFRYALDHVGLPAQEVLFVGDALVPDVRGPSRAGMRTAFLSRRDATGWAGLGADGNGRHPPNGVPVLRDLRDALALALAGPV
jgi:putative hydrolase of the HAD superfamily